MNGKYDDILSLPHKEPRNRVRMMLQNRAAQFAPFAALTGLDSSMTEEARLTDEKRETSEFESAEINERLNELLAAVGSGERPSVTVKYFVEDRKKSGGAYVTVTGTLRRIDEVNGKLIFTDIPPVLIDSICGFAENRT